MRLQAVFVHSHIFIYDKDGNAYSEGKLTYETWKRYLKCFGNLVVVGRYENKENVLKYNISSGDKVSHIKLKRESFLSERLKIINNKETVLEDIIKKSDVVIARLPSQEGARAIKIAKKLNKPYIIELVGDVFSALWFHGSLIRKLYAPFAYLKERKILKEAKYVLYVTENFLQSRYPSKNIRVMCSCSNVELNANIKEFKKINTDNDIFRIGIIGSYSSKYKGIDNALRVVKKLIDHNINVELRILGTGDPKEIKKLSTELGIEENIKLDGSLPAGSAVFNWLNQLDLYIQPSLTEGLPRALIEAMYLELPCIASNVGGIPELLPCSALHNPKDEQELFRKILRMYNDVEFRTKHSLENGLRAKNYTKTNLDAKRTSFLNKVIADLNGGVN